jgi:hypothetical protein
MMNGFGFGVIELVNVFLVVILVIGVPAVIIYYLAKIYQTLRRMEEREKDK